MKQYYFLLAAMLSLTATAFKPVTIFGFGSRLRLHQQTKKLDVVLGKYSMSRTGGISQLSSTAGGESDDNSMKRFGDALAHNIYSRDKAIFYCIKLWGCNNVADVQRVYREGSTTVAYREFDKPFKYPFSVVVGTMGSGKSFFSLMEATEKLKTIHKHERAVTCYVSSGELRGKTVEEVSQNVITETRRLLDAEAEELGIEFGPDGKLGDDIFLVVVIDEAGHGGEGGKDIRSVFLDETDPKINIANTATIASSLSTIAPNYHMVMAGTVIENYTMMWNVDEVLKFRMQPSTMKNFASMLG